IQIIFSPFSFVRGISLIAVIFCSAGIGAFIREMFILKEINELSNSLNNTKLRVIWIIPNVFCYLMFVGFSTFVVLNAKGLEEINSLSIWVFMMLMLLFVSILGSYRIWTWIK